ncbi:nucleotidyl transferase AbiEii/AbiGii toxin family protein [Pseudonocardia ammonioxydans]|uniref:nucleotidyl transferase AbiEii/AbiGii toxin family protein n=1 Tax=Pseudonocardia ammonioxydans TaxID=260086 RepID=UPI0015A6AF91|nr:nucleotidyl transferase AbiEii/AbiGii toxin family protein [Pseudonocardia ammonioxydans]
MRNRKHVAFDRLLARLAATAPDRWLLKGGYALDLRLRSGARTTKDVDLDWREVDEELLDTLFDAAEHDMGDYFIFSVERRAHPADRLEGSQRFLVSVSLAGREFETFPLDIAVRAEPIIAYDTLTTADLLGFADVAPVQVPAIRLERQIAEKLHAYTRTYEGDRHSSRTKDLVDIVLIADLESLDAAALRDAIERTFATRGTHPLPQAVPAPPAEWSPPFRELAAAVGLPTDLAAAHTVAVQLLEPVLDGRISSGTWDTEKRRWTREREESDLNGGRIE